MSDDQKWELRRCAGGFHWVIVSDDEVVATGEPQKKLMGAIRDAELSGCPDDQFPLELVSNFR